MRNVLPLLALILAAQPAFAAAHRSGLKELTGLKYPTSGEEGKGPVAVSALALPTGGVPGGFNELLGFALRSPDQEEAGSCLYMSLTGAAEWWLARLHPRQLRTPDGPIDLSERFLMNVAGLEEDENGIANWKTDSIYLFNKIGYTLLNRDYRFTKGWYVRDAKGEPQPGKAGDPGAAYDAYYSWIDERASVPNAPHVALPRFRREVLFADPASNQWNTGVMPSDIVERIKNALVKNKAPVQVIYNHFGYWHATLILGFDDGQDNLQCKFVNRFLDYMPKKAAEARAQAAQEKDPAVRERLLRQAAKADAAHAGTERAFREGGGCHPQGVFYVRDSIYKDPEGPIYDYDPSQTGEESPYVKSSVMLEYDWVRTMANHATQILVE